MKFTTTDAEGRFSFSRMCKGSLRLQAGLASHPDVGFLDAQGGDKDVRLILGRRGVHTYHASLAGKPLPKLDVLGLRSTLIPPGRRILICFWDINQRPSRNCIIGLARRLNKLKEKDIEVVTVQAAKADERGLKQWLKKYRIPFPVGMIQGHPQTTRLEWGVKSLPWLILTDTKHVIRAEGFGVNELDDKLKQNSGG